MNELVNRREVYGARLEDMLHRLPSIAKIRGASGWEPLRDLNAILDDVVAERRGSMPPVALGPRE